MEFEPLDIGNDVIEYDEMGNSNSGGEDDDVDNNPDGYDHRLLDDDNSNTSNDFLTLNEENNLEPYEGMEFDSEQAARVFYNSYARRIGFSTRVSVYQRSRRDGSIICRQIVCSREGFRREGSENRSKRQRTITRVGCKAQMTVKKQSSGKWAVSKLVKEHNHELVPPDKVHCLRSHRHVSGPARSLIDTLQAAGMGPSGVMSVLIKESGGVNNELFETLAYPATIANDTGSDIIYRVAKFGEEHKPHFVKFIVFERKASCSCQTFEFSGIICRHILAVFRVTNVLTLPPHYILKRWTRNAKSGVLLNDHILGLPSNSQESSAARYDNLRQEVIKYVEEGAESTHVYNVAMDALREAAKKVAAAKKHGPGPPQNNLSSESQQLQSCSVDQDKEIQELTVELECASQRCEAYRVKLLAVLKDMEEQKLKMLVKVQNVRLNLKG
ncbi:hypothetical protein JRO89_XSUnG0020900 [Xanthoceras sorbifolium]|uniref:Protein FAR1-RELATED SEQUENCE n=1 Tax=Xanthoceras sorbifolium TaxID=99658 RepID=A0ABQ8H080_9ROSI|nr:hypothetical protein JRO89_XSUnG0020900 [Xanthoceras sorbifolium]